MSENIWTLKRAGCYGNGPVSIERVWFMSSHNYKWHIMNNGNPILVWYPTLTAAKKAANVLRTAQLNATEKQGVYFTKLLEQIQSRELESISIKINNAVINARWGPEDYQRSRSELERARYEAIKLVAQIEKALS